ncbi:Mitotic spindle checkpoint component mad2 [Friedmanniomyces endolithicus]|uniref:Mitotic spindle checkpoint component mad2 n=1 Tax=Friedmanniomyces endolithicus TaxID=329885 RepID=A0AAN6HBB8_9PEZI|nr:Mitotic spindle checkpoint component mad2 [Friedmanniomyces endolithicus]KAK0270983.1 Mitotic spindle checkpoint component mad2 [Friedmanniomyces endolithicus]KAK0277023.1 Mitotic spindle checkpoint component mad2 [Friedmanniomyces endolithicus]KAK0305810.1 Mitotic spindle checkpoint component mad2 [Friedmanniomyces endolithicus]KAK0314107.1 Mitotic spindle checkpoint component mad2 [Friedmanniomyces endolithicus]
MPSAMPPPNPSSTTDKSKTHKLALKGSSKTVVEFFDYACNTILFQRGVYPPEDFTTVKKYGLNMMTSCDDQVKAYIKKIMSQLSRWMQKAKISKLVVVITSKETGEHVERWQFDVDHTKPYPTTKLTEAKVNVFQDPSKQTHSTTTGDKENSAPQQPAPDSAKSDDDVQKEIQALFRQVTASVTMLPMLDGNCTFNVLVYADADSEVPLEWGDSDAKEIRNAENVKLRSFSTKSHRIDTVVSYRLVAAGQD